MSTATTPSDYDTFRAPELDAAKWFYLEYPLLDGPRVCREPTARIAVGDGRLRVEVDRFELAHSLQPVDNCKFVLLSTQTYDIPASGTLTVRGRIGAADVGGSGDYRDGFASLIAIEPSTGLVFDVAATGREVFAIHERLPVSDEVASFTRIVDAPLSGLDTGPDVEHDCAMTIDARRRSVTWTVDGVTIFDANEIPLPRQIHVGLGIFTLHPVSDGESRSRRGQGLHASWSNVSVSVDD